MTDEFEAVIERLGARGDGIADTPAGPIYVPLVLPGERVRVSPGAKRGEGRAAALVELLEPSADRVETACAHFGECGGCSVQHLSESAYLDWKRGLVVAALERHGISAEVVEPVVQTAPGGRRRAELAALRLRGRRGRTLLGFHERASNRIVDVAECVVLRPALFELIAPLRDVLSKVLDPGSGCDLLLTETRTGVDLLITAKTPPRPLQSQALAAFAAEAGLARVSWASPRGGTEPVAQLAQPTVEIAGVPVAVPSGSFLQASAEAEQALTALVLDHLVETPAGSRLADLYAGVGTFALPLAQKGYRVHAADNAGDALESLLAAAGLAGFSGRITTDTRDLSERSLMAAELSDYGAVVFDPPRAGAAAVAEQLAVSGVPTVVAVSCNPATFARDAATLIEGGYRLTRVTPVDQFVYTGHVELVAGFVRD